MKFYIMATRWFFYGLLCLGSIGLFIGCNGTSKSTAEGWYKTFEGKYGNRNIVLHLTKSDALFGYFRFTDSQVPILIFSDPTAKPAGDSVYLNGGMPGLSISIKGVLKKDISGTLSIETNGVQDPAQAITLSPSETFSPFDFIYSKGEATLPAKLKNESSISYFAGTVWPTTSGVWQDSLRYSLRKFLELPASDASPKKDLDSLQQTAISGWKAEGDKLTPEEADNMGMSFSEQVHQNLTVLYEDEKVLAIAGYVYLYTGGAHGHYSTTVWNIDKTNGKKILLYDILKPEGIAMLPMLLEEAARKQFDVRNTNSLEENGFFVNTIMPTENFYVTSAGIGFYFAPYEIRPYADGEINLFIPKESFQNGWK